jgi:N-acetylglucosamine-6-phosphate deacetylase
LIVDADPARIAINNPHSTINTESTITNQESSMIVLTGGDLVLPDRILSDASLVLEGGRLAAVESRSRVEPSGATVIDVRRCYVVPGFIDVHVHGLEGVDTLDAGAPIARIAAMLPRYGVTSFCPTTVACPPAQLTGVLEQVRPARAARAAGSARVLPAHLESNFVNPEYRGAQPADCLRQPLEPASEGTFSAKDVLDAIATWRADVGIVTLAPELPGGVELIRSLTAHGHRVSLGHSGASYDEAIAAIEAGARHATHLFNRMTPIAHRQPGLAGAVLACDEIAAELICDAYHVHPGMCRMAIAAKGARGIMAITDGTGGSGLAPGAFARLGGRRIRVSDEAVVLDDGTLAGSSLTMDRAFRTIVNRFGRSVIDAAVMCATTPARQLRLTGLGTIEEGAVADLVVLDRDYRVVHTFIDGIAVYRSGAAA